MTEPHVYDDSLDCYRCGCERAPDALGWLWGMYNYQTEDEVLVCPSCATADEIADLGQWLAEAYRDGFEMLRTAGDIADARTTLMIWAEDAKQHLAAEVVAECVAFDAEGITDRAITLELETP